MIDVLNKEKREKFFMLSAHDASMQPFLKYLKQDVEVPYASSLFIEIYTKEARKYVRFVFND